LCFGFYSVVYGYMNHVAEERLAYIRQEVKKGKTKIAIPRIPYSNKYSLGMNPRNKRWQYNFKNYYHIPQEVTFRYQKYEKWKKKVK